MLLLLYSIYELALLLIGGGIEMELAWVGMPAGKVQGRSKCETERDIDVLNVYKYDDTQICVTNR